MAWVNWSRKSQETSATRGPLGVDLNAGRARAAHGRTAKNKLFPLDEPYADLPLAIALDRRIPEVGRAALAMSRKSAHALCVDYLPHLGQQREWKTGRHALNANAATGFALERLRLACTGHDGVALALPSYLTLPQVTRLLVLAEKLKIKVRGTATAALALAAERATHFLYGQPEEAKESSPRNGRSISPTSVLIVDADDHALTASVIRISEEDVRVQTAITSIRLAVRLWRERLLDSISDRCVRLCRRDPRDTADAEQMLFDQLDDAIERSMTGQRISLSVRSTHWYQDLVLTTAEMDAFCTPLCRIAAEEVRGLLAGLTDPEPPRAVWLTHDAGRLPGLAAALHHNMSERTNVRVLHPEAAAGAVANLLDRWDAGELPRTHLDTSIPLPYKADTRPAPRPAATPKTLNQGSHR